MGYAIRLFSKSLSFQKGKKKKEKEKILEELSKKEVEIKKEALVACA